MKNPKWSILACEKNTIKPPQRYGHTMIYYKPYLLLFGGVLREKNHLSNRVWLCKIEYSYLFSNPTIKWEQVQYNQPEEMLPEPRLYHSMGIIKAGKAKGMIILFGGRDINKKALNDCWGLRKHRNGNWEWIIAPKKGSGGAIKRFQHSVLFYKQFMIVIGGRSENTEFYLKGLPLNIYDSITHEWYNIFSFGKFRNAAFTLDKLAFLHGGCDMMKYNEKASSDLVSFDMQMLCEKELLDQKDKKYSEQGELNLNSIKKNFENINKEENNDNNNEYKNNIKKEITPSSTLFDGNCNFTKIKIKPVILNKADLSCISVSDDSSIDNSENPTPNISTDDIKTDEPKTKESLSLSYLSFHNIHIQNEVKKVSLDEKNKFQIINNLTKENFELYENFIESLLKPNAWKNIQKTETGISKFKFRREHIIALTKACQEVVASQPIVLRLNTPIKVFGDIHGQYDDLMRFFELWGEPSENPSRGDINSIDYLFLGDYVDRGIYSLETICLLMALKIKYPDKIHLLRGNHEDHLINSTFGFYEECEYRLSDDALCDELNVFKIINEFFEYLPLVAIVENEIVCVHGGIGSCFTDISDVEKMQRPLPVIHEALTKEDQIIMDILWSDPTDNDSEKGIQPNVIRDSKSYGNIVKFGPDIVENFLNKNNVHMIIRAHECVPDGFERFSAGKLITVFSATDYCKRHKNAGGMLLITNNFEIIPHLIYPISTLKVKWIEKDDYIKKRPPTPIRKRRKNSK